MTLSLAVEKRTADVSADAVRTAGKIPGVVYGPKHTAESIAVDARTFEKVFKEAGESTIVKLEGLDTETEVLIHDVAFNPARGGVMHIDFYAIERGKELTTNVPLEFVGEAPVEKRGATANKIIHEIEVTCRPSNLPSHIDVDLSVLTDDASVIHVSDLIIPEGVTVENEPTEIVANVAAAREEEPEEAPAVDMAAIAVEKKGKTEAE
jgi:large subunit ribosomal protein L25